MTTYCADCGERVYRHRDKWATRVESGTLTQLTPEPSSGWSFCCRATIDGGRLLSADYHYIRGEAQRHWPVRS